jgi:hypothetical protein
MPLLTQEQLTSFQPLDAEHLPENGQAIEFVRWNRDIRKGVFYLPSEDAGLRNHIGYLSETAEYCVYFFYKSGPHMAITGWRPDPSTAIRRDVDFLLAKLEERERAFKEVLQEILNAVQDRSDSGKAVMLYEVIEPAKRLGITLDLPEGYEE